jgi:CPA1 family monovalent cation:H+ antiporter
VLPWTLRHLTLPLPNLAQERVEMQLLLAEAQTAGLRVLDGEADGVDERVAGRLRTNATFLSDAIEDLEAARTLTKTYGELRARTLDAERRAVLAARAEGRYQEPAVRAVLTTIDAEESALRVAARRS